MRRASSHASLLPSLHPALQAALSSLDVQLEAELTRYRRQRHLQRRRQHDAKPMNLIAVQAVGGRTQPPAPTPDPASLPDSDPWQAEPAAPLAVRAPIAPEREAALDAAELGRATIASTFVPDPVTVLQPDVPPDQTEPDDYLASSEELLRSLAEEEADLRRQRQAQGQSRLLTPLGIGSLLLMLLSSATLGYLVLNPGTLRGWNLDRFWNRSAPPAAVTPSESSEAIAPAAAPSPDLSSEEFRDLNLDTLSTLPVTPSPTVSPASPASPTVAASPSAPAPSVAVAPPTASIAPRPQVARSAAQTPRPVAIEPPRVIVPRRPAPAPLPAQRPAPRPTARSTQPARSTQARTAPARSTARTQPARPPQRAARPAAPAPRRAAARPATPAPTPAAARPNQPPRYFVVGEYRGDRSLEQAQQVVGDAYVRNSSNGARVQYGAFGDADRARALSEQLQRQGISAQVVEQPEGN